MRGLTGVRERALGALADDLVDKGFAINLFYSWGVAMAPVADVTGAAECLVRVLSS